MDTLRWHNRYEPGSALGPNVRTAWDRLAGRTVVEKRAEAAEELAALATETQLLARAHPAFPRLFDVDGALAQPRAIAVELVSGARLSSSTVRAGALTGLLADLLAALEHLHRRGFVHGDLKPEHLLVDDASGGRVIDLGLARPIGSAVRGGTPRYLPPEYRDGAPASAAGDLFSFGAAMLHALENPPSEVRRLLVACTQAEPSRRPTSALACINALGETRRQLDVAGSFERRGSRAALDSAVQTMNAARGLSLVVHAEPGSGRRRFVRDLEGHGLAAGMPMISVRIDEAPGFVARLSAVIGVRLAGDPLRDLGSVGSAAARAGFTMILNARDHGIAEAQILNASFSRACKGALIILASSSMILPGSERVEIARAHTEDVNRLFEAAGARLDDALREVMLTKSGGCMGLLARLARQAAREPLTSVAAVERALEQIAAPAASQRPSETALTFADADLAFRRGEFVRAASIADQLRPPADVEPPLRARIDRLRASALARSGDYARARDAIATMTDPSTEDWLLHLECLERLGLHREAKAAAQRLEGEDAVGVAALAVGAHVTLALGEPVAAEEMATRGLERAADFLVEARDGSKPGELGLFTRAHEVVGRLWSIRSDAALRQSHVDDAISFAEAARVHALQHHDDGLAAQAYARLGAARGLTGDPQRALAHYAEALIHAERAGDLGRLPAFIMNLATAEHALGDVSGALEHYQEAATLAERLGRKANLLAATVNLAGLWIYLGARVEAETLLDRADALADELGDRVYRAQSVMLRAELAAGADVPRALELAKDAHARFIAAGATRQALEANLLAAELALRAGSTERALMFLEREQSSLDEAGLGARASLLATRSELAAGRPDAALRHAERVLATSTDRELTLLARFELARANEARVPGSGTEAASLAREELTALTDSLPRAVRERFVKAPERIAVERGLARPAVVQGPSGLGGEAKRLLGLVRRLLLEGEESRVLETAIDEAVQLTGAERAFLVLARPRGNHEIVVARNVERAALKGASFRFSRSVVDRVIKTGEAVITASALEDPSLDRTRSILDLGLRSILAVPIRGPHAVLGALYLDHRIERGRFAEAERELTVALADIVGIALEKTRLVEQAERRADASERQTEAALRENVEKAREVERLASLLKRAKTAPEDQGGIVGSSHKLLAALDVARRVAKSDLPVLVRGESGTGKELFARFVHAESARKTGPFVAINCGAVPESLLESELFGHKRGAFTGAVTDSPGLFRLADGGTLFLDEIGEMPIRMQTRLLRVLQEGEVRAVGGSENVKVDVRILAATHRNLEEATGLGTFREDLYYRLLGARVTLPALRERREDILEIARVVLSRLEKRYARTFALSREAEATLLRHDWPGNVRELEQSLTRGALLAEGPEIAPENLDLRRHETTRRVELQNLDRTLIEQALYASKGNRTLAAKALGVSRVTLHRWMKRYDVS